MEPDKRERLLTFIDNFWIENWTSPTVREIGKWMGWTSTATTHYHLKKLVDESFLSYRETPSRVLYRRKERQRF